MRIGRLVLGMAFGLLVVGALWYGGWILPPEGLSRRVALLHAVFPGSPSAAQVKAIECPPLGRLRLYAVCTRDCDEVWRIVLVKGLRAHTLASFGSASPVRSASTRHRLNAAVGREALRLDAEGARELLGCYLRIDGLHPELVLPDGGSEAVAEARRKGEEAMQRLADNFEQEGATRRIRVEETTQGFEAEMLYWDTWRAGRPVLMMRVKLARDGQVREVRTWPLPSPARGTPEEDQPGED